MLQRFIFIYALIFSFCAIGNAQEETAKTGWQKEATTGLNLTQNTFDNWSQGGENTLSWQAMLNYKFEFNQKDLRWLNTGKLNYGMVKSGEEESKKSIDEIKLESVLTYKLGVDIDPYVGIAFDSQLGPGYDYTTNPKVQITRFMDPGYIRESAGFGYKPGDMLFVRAGVAVKHTFVKDTRIVAASNELGAEMVSDFSWKFSKHSKLDSKLELFSNLEAFDQIDANWDNTLSTRVTQYINMNFNVKIVYDKDISAKRQLKQVMGIGFAYNFF